MYEAFACVEQLKNLSPASFDLYSKGTCPFSSMVDITVDPKGVAKLFNGLNIHKAPGLDGLNARVLKVCCNEISPILALISLW